MVSDNLWMNRKWVFIGLAIALGLSATALLYFHRSLTLRQAQLLTDLSKIEQQLAHQPSLPESSAGITFSKPENIYEFIEKHARRSRMNIVRLIIPEPKPDQKHIDVELAVSGEYPDLIRYFSYLQANSQGFDLNSLVILASSYPGATLQADVKLRFALETGGVR